MTTVGLLALASLAAIALLVLFIGWERRGRSINAVMLILWMLVVESVLYPQPFDVPLGLLHPGTGSLTFRLYELLIPMALAARLGVRPPRVAGPTAVLWIAFAVWVMSEAFMGMASGHPLDLVGFEAKAVVYVAGGFALAAGVPLRHWVSVRWIDSLVVGTAVIAGVLAVTTRTGWRLEPEVPGLRGIQIGAIGSDTASVFVAIGVLGLCVGACHRKGGMVRIVAAGPLLMSAVLVEQRAALLGAVLSLLVIALALVTPGARRRLQVTPTEWMLLALAGLAVLIVPVVRGANQGVVNVPFTNSIQQVIESRGKQLSAEGRVNQWRKVRPLLGERSLVGWGLGKTYVYYEPGPAQFVRTNLTHNIAGDLILRTGLVGLVLFSAAVARTVADGVTAWRRHADPLAASVALAGVAIVAGLLLKGMVESIFEKYRLITLLGLSLGMIRAIASQQKEVEWMRHKEPVSEWS